MIHFSVPMQDSNPSEQYSHYFYSSIDSLFHSSDSLCADIPIVHRQVDDSTTLDLWQNGESSSEEDGHITPHCSMESTVSTWDVQNCLSPNGKQDSVHSEDCTPLGVERRYISYRSEPETSELFINNRNTEECLTLHLLLKSPRSDIKDRTITKELSPLYESPCLSSANTTVAQEENFSSTTTTTDTWESVSTMCSTISQSPCAAPLNPYIQYDVQHELCMSLGRGCLLDDTRHVTQVLEDTPRGSVGVTLPEASEKWCVTTPSQNLEELCNPETISLKSGVTDSTSSDALPVEGSPFMFGSSSSLSSTSCLDINVKTGGVVYSGTEELQAEGSPSRRTHSFNGSDENLCNGVYLPNRSTFLPSATATTSTPVVPAVATKGPFPTDVFNTPPVSSDGPSTNATSYMVSYETPKGHSAPETQYTGGSPFSGHLYPAQYSSPVSKNNEFPLSKGFFQFKSNQGNIGQEMCSDHEPWMPTYPPPSQGCYTVDVECNEQSKTMVIPECSEPVAPSPVFRLSRSPTARAAIVQYPYPPVPAHCLPPLKHTQQQALFNEFLKIERDALRIQLGHFIVEYCTRSIPDEFLRSERPPDPRIITDFVDQIILAVEIFGEHAQYVHAHNTIPTDINEVYISTWLQQKKEFLKPLEMLYVRREKEKLLGGQNNCVELMPNTVPYLLKSHPRRKNYTSKASRDKLSLFECSSVSQDHLTSSSPTEDTTRVVKEHIPRHIPKNVEGAPHASPRYRRGKDCRTSASSSNGRLTRRIGLSLGEELDGLGVPRSIHYENLRSAIEHRGIVVQLPSNNSVHHPRSDFKSKFRGHPYRELFRVLLG